MSAPEVKERLRIAATGNKWCVGRPCSSTMKETLRMKNSKLNWAQVREIRELAGTITQAQLAKQFNVSRPTVNLIIHNKTWREND
jgi:hypothetical protein